MTVRPHNNWTVLTIVALFAGTLAAVSSTASAQTTQLRGVNQSGTARLPSAQQQLNQNLNRQQNNFSTQQRIDSANRLNRTQQINRNTTRTDTFSTCAGANLACRD